MFEFDKYEPHRRSIPLTVSSGPSLPPVEVESAAFLLWSEHCIECAAPACYSSCDLYVPRPDGRCRRFAFGMGPNVALAGPRGPAAEIVFGRWAKLEARGNARLIGEGRLKAVERAASVICGVLDSAGRLLAPLMRDRRWTYLGFALFERLNAMVHRMGSRSRPDAFVLDLYNPGDKDVSFLLSMIAYTPPGGRYLAPEAVPSPFRRRVTVPPGRFREIIPSEEFRHVTDSGLPFNIALTPQGEDGSHVVVIQLDLVRLAASARPSPAPPAAKRGGTLPAAKCVVFDLDHTLWEGVLLETDRVRLRSVVPGLLKTLDERGILLSIASKNAHDHAMAKLREFGLDEYFIYPKINWGSKSENVKRIAKDIDIGLDTFIFVDDNPFELEEVRQALGVVECVPVEELERLLAHPRLQGSASPEARNRRALYRTAMVRSEAQAAFGDDYLAFLKASDIRLTVRPDRPEDFERVAELVQRTNQLNFSGRKYTREELLKRFDNPALERYVIACRDRYGDYGTVGFCMAVREGTTVRIEDLMLSCRVQGKYIEPALFGYLCERQDPPATRLLVNFKKTDRNLPAQHVLAKLGFDLDSEGPLSRDVSAGTFAVDCITIEPS